MANYIQTNLRYNKMLENGVIKTVTEQYLVGAMSFTEAEARITEEMAPFISGEFSVSAVKKTKIAEIFFDDNAERNYLAKVNFITIDERSAVEKRQASLILIQADSFHDAVHKLDEGMKGTIADYEIASVAETQILEVFTFYPYEKTE